MSQYQAIKAAVNANIKANGRKEITGTILNSVLNAIIASLGRYYQFAGVAFPSTDPGTPDQNVAYLAGTPGTYTNFGGLEVSAGEIAVLKFDGTWVKEAFYSNPPLEVDEDDLIVNPEKGLQFANRENGVNTTGKSFVILRRDKTFAEQVTEEETIYEIRDSFDLGNTSVNVPKGSLLYFNGGIIKNGTLSGDFLVAGEDKKIFSNVVFSGNCTTNQEFLIDWFVENISLDYQHLVSCTSEIQDAINSNVETLRFSNKLYYCPGVVNSTRAVNILGDMEHLSMTNTPETRSNIKTGIYTDQHNTIFNFTFSNDKEMTMDISGLLFISDYSNSAGSYADDDVPILSFNEGRVMDLDIDCDMYFIGSKDGDGWRDNHGKGVYIHAGNSSYYNFIRTHGIIHGAVTGYDLDKSGNGWLSDFHHDGDLYAVKGIVTKAGLCVCRGSYQPQARYLTTDNGEGFIDAYGQVILYSFVYDLNTAPGQYTGGTAQWAVVRKQDGVNVTTTIPFLQDKIFPFMGLTETERDLPAASSIDNLYFTDPSKVSIKVKSIDNDVESDITSECTITGINKLFNPFFGKLSDKESMKVTFPNQTYSWENIQVEVKLTGLSDLDYFTFGRNFLFIYSLKASASFLNGFKYVDILVNHGGNTALSRQDVLLENNRSNVNKFTFPLAAYGGLSGTTDITLTFKGLKKNEANFFVSPFGITNEYFGNAFLSHGGVINGDVLENAVTTEKQLAGINSGARQFKHIRMGANFEYQFGYSESDIYIGSFTKVNSSTYDVFLFGKCLTITPSQSRYSAGEFVAHIHMESGAFVYGDIRHPLDKALKLNGIVDSTAGLVHLYVKTSQLAGTIQVGFNLDSIVSTSQLLNWEVYTEDITGHTTTSFTLDACPAYNGSYPTYALEGSQIFHTSLKKMLYRIENSFVDAFGFPPARKVGTTAQRPSASTMGAGYWYYDTGLGRVIWSNGTTWVAEDGQSFTRAGTTAQRPTSNRDAGFTYFDTDLGKMIVWNGTAWVNMDGTALA